VLKVNRRSGAAVIDGGGDDDGQGVGGARRKDMIALALAGVAVCGILVNALFLQKGRHPAPIFSAKPAAAPQPAVSAPVVAAMPRPRPSEPEALKVEAPPVKADALPARSRLELIAEIQKELGKRGFYDGAADGVHGPKTEAAIRDFEQQTGLRHAGGPDEQLLRAIAQSNAKAKSAATASAPRHDPIAELIAPSPQKRILAVQRALSDFGYGQIKPTGTLDAPTQDAIGQFERAKRMPVTGQISPRLLRELSATTGRPLE
jgi:peptidoglycan hydrolase-like protein with peptidoglycan-binding domain